MKLRDAISSSVVVAPTDSSSQSGKKFYVQDTRYGYVVGEYQTQEEAAKAAGGRPFSKVVTDVPATVQRDSLRWRQAKHQSGDMP